MAKTLFGGSYGMGSHASDVRNEAIDLIYGEVRNHPNRASKIGQIAGEAAKMFSGNKYGGGVINPFQYQEALDEIKKIAGGGTHQIDHFALYNSETLKAGQAGKFFENLEARMAKIGGNSSNSLLGDPLPKGFATIASPLLGPALDAVKTPELVKGIDGLDMNEALMANNIGHSLSTQLPHHVLGIDKFSQLKFDGHEQYQSLQQDLGRELAQNFDALNTQHMQSDIVKSEILQGKMDPADLVKNSGLPGMDQQKGVLEKVLGDNKGGLDKAISENTPKEKIEAIQKETAKNESFGLEKQDGSAKDKDFGAMLKGQPGLASLNQMSVADSAQQTAGVSPTMVQNQQQQQSQGMAV